MTTDVRSAIAWGAASGVLAFSGSAAGQGSVPQLAPVVVQAAEPEAADTRDRTWSAVATSATKTATSVMRTPQSITTVTRKQLDAQDPQTVSEALRYTAGVLADRDVNVRYDSVFLRGFGAFGTATNYVNYLDGLKLPRGQAFAQTAIDPYLLDRVDVLKGPSAVLYGQVSPGGLVNQISRQPGADAAHEIRVQAGTDRRFQSAFSSRGALQEDGSLQYSVSAVGRTSGTRYDHVDEQRYGIAPSITWRPSADTALTLSGYYQKDPKGGYFNSLYPDFLAPAGYGDYLTRRFNVGDPDFDAFERRQSGLGYRLEHRVNDGLTLRSSLRQSRVDTDFRSLQMSGPLSAQGILPRHALQSIEDVRGLSMDNQAQFDLQTGAVQHTVLVGLDYQRTRSNWQYRFGGAPVLDVTQPHYGQPIGPLATIIDSGQTLRQTGVYVQDQLTLGRMSAVLGVRRDWTRQETDNRLAGSMQQQRSHATSARAGAIYQFDNGIAPYASYATSFEPTVGLDQQGTPFVPSKARQYEVGVKFQPQQADALFTVSAFDIAQRDALVPDRIGFNVQAGKIRSRGFELEARGEATRNLELIAALTLLDTTVKEAALPENAGKRPQAVPRYFGSVWANYTYHSGMLAGLRLGAGVRVVGSSYADNANTIKAAGYTVVDAALRYDFGARSPSLKGLEGTLNVNNLFDKTYYASCSSDIYCQFGNGRQVLAGLQYRW